MARSPCRSPQGFPPLVHHIAGLIQGRIPASTWCIGRGTVSAERHMGAVPGPLGACLLGGRTGPKVVEQCSHDPCGGRRRRPQVRQTIGRSWGPDRRRLRPSTGRRTLRAGGHVRAVACATRGPGAVRGVLPARRPHPRDPSVAPPRWRTIGMCVPLPRCALGLPRRHSGPTQAKRVRDGGCFSSNETIT